MGPVRLLIIRHGESSNNLLHSTTGSFEGRSPDPELTELGRRQAEALARAMLDGDQPAPDILYCSLMLRAVQTAAPIADALRISITGHLEAYECGGPYEGSPQHPKPHPGAPAQRLLAESSRLVLPDGVDGTGWYRGHGEDDPARAARGRRVIDGLLDRHQGHDVLVGVVCHEWISQHLIRAALGFDAKDGIAEPWFGLSNTGTTLIDMERPVPMTEALHDGGPMERVLVWHNQTRHLPRELFSGQVDHKLFGTLGSAK